MRSVKSYRCQAVLFCVCLFASLTLAEFLPAQVTTYKGTFQGPTTSSCSSIGIAVRSSGFQVRARTYPTAWKASK